MMIDEKTVEQARNTDMIAFLEKRSGFTFTTRRGAYRCKQRPRLAVKGDRRSWYWYSKSIGGCGELDYLMKIEQMLFREAVEAVTGIAAAPMPPPSAGRSTPEQPITLFLPEKAGIPRHLYDYLCVKRGIDSDNVNTLMQKETLYEDRWGNVFNMTFSPSERLYVFESPIDAMSHASL
jgi:hypothetical protein